MDFWLCIYWIHLNLVIPLGCLTKKVELSHPVYFIFLLSIKVYWTIIIQKNQYLNLK